VFPITIVDWTEPGRLTRRMSVPALAGGAERPAGAAGRRATGEALSTSACAWDSVRVAGDDEQRATGRRRAAANFRTSSRVMLFRIVASGCARRGACRRSPH